MLRIMAGIALLSLAGIGTAHAADEDPVRIGGQKKISITSAPAAEGEYTDYDAYEPAAALNNRDTDPVEGLLESKILFVAWRADDNTRFAPAPDEDSEEIRMVDEEFEIWGRGLEPRRGEFFFSSPIRISKMGPDDETDPAERARYQAFKPSVAYNEDTDQFLVVWYGDDNSGSLVDDEYEIWGRLIGGSGVEDDLETEPFRITTVGPEAETDPVERARYGAFDPKVVTDPTTGGFMLVYRADDPNFTAASGDPLADDEFEIFAQRLNADGTPNGNPVRVSTMGDDNETDPAIRANFGVGAPALAWNDTAGQFMVAWHGDDNTGGLVDDENEIYVRGINPDGQMPNPQARISAMGPDGDPAYDAFDPDIAVNSFNGEYMVTWSGDDDTAPLVDDEFEIFARRLTSAGVPADARFRVSQMGTESESDPAIRASFDADSPSIAYHPGSGRFQVSWRGDDDTELFVEGEIQAHGQAVNADGTLHGDRFQISDTAAEEDPETRREHTVHSPESIYAAGNIMHYFTADGPDSAVIVPGHFEVFQQRISTMRAQVYAEFEKNRPTVPDPITATYTVFNTGPDPLVNVEVWVTMTEDMPLDVTGCSPYDDTTRTCHIDDIPVDGQHTITASIDTSGIELGDVQGTQLTFTLHSDTALVDYFDEKDRRISFDGGDFVSAVLKVEGGSGALLPLVPVLLLLWGFVARRRG